MHGHVVAHCDHLPGRIEHRARIIPALFNIGRKCCSSQNCAHLLRNRASGALKDGQFDWIKVIHQFLCGADAYTSIIRFEYPATPTFHPGGTTVVALYSCTIAGPSKRLPGRSKSRCRILVSKRLPSKTTHLVFATARSHRASPGSLQGGLISSLAAIIRTRAFTISTLLVSSACP